MRPLEPRPLIPGPRARGQWQGVEQETAQPWHAQPCFGPFAFYDVRGKESVPAGGASIMNKAEANMVGWGGWGGRMQEACTYELSTPRSQCTLFALPPGSWPGLAYLGCSPGPCQAAQICPRNRPPPPSATWPSPSKRALTPRPPPPPRRTLRQRQVLQVCITCWPEPIPTPFAADPGRFLNPQTLPPPHTHMPRRCSRCTTRWPPPTPSCGAPPALPSSHHTRRRSVVVGWVGLLGRQ